MSASIAVRLHRDSPVPPAALVLDWTGRGSDPVRSDLADLFEGVTPTPEAVDFFVLASCVYLADKVVLRRLALDRWSRNIELHVPQSDDRRWDPDHLGRFLYELTADRWSVRPYRCERTYERFVPATPALPLPGPKEVTLFSGGLDSFAWVAGRVARRPALIAHSDTTALGPLQRDIAEGLSAGPPLSLRRFWLRLNHRGPLVGAEFEATTRSRSVLFVAAAVAVAQATGVTKVTVPENGFIALNPPMVPARSGTLSTRTTHPTTLASMNDLLAEAGIDVIVENPFILRTKGDVARLAVERAPAELAFSTVSCSHPSARRTDPLHYGNCGYCFPCLVRRSGFHAAGVVDLSIYRRDPRTDEEMLHRASGDDFKAVVTGLSRAFGVRDLRSAGRLPAGSDLPALTDVVERSRAELRSMVNDGLSGEVRRAIGW